MVRSSVGVVVGGGWWCTARMKDKGAQGKDTVEGPIRVAC